MGGVRARAAKEVVVVLLAATAWEVPGVAAMAKGHNGGGEDGSGDEGGSEGMKAAEMAACGDGGGDGGGGDG